MLEDEMTKFCSQHITYCHYQFTKHLTSLMFLEGAGLHGVVVIQNIVLMVHQVVDLTGSAGYSFVSICSSEKKNSPTTFLFTEMTQVLSQISGTLQLPH